MTRTMMPLVTLSSRRIARPRIPRTVPMIPNTQVESFNVNPQSQIRTARIAIAEQILSSIETSLESLLFLSTFYLQAEKAARMSVDGGKLQHQFIDRVPKLFEHCPHVFNVRLIDTVRGIHTFSKLIEIIAILRCVEDHWRSSESPVSVHTHQAPSFDNRLLCSWCRSAPFSFR